MVFLLNGSNKHYKNSLIGSLRGKYKDFAFYSLDCNDSVNVTISVLDGLLNQVSLFDAEKKIIYLKNFLSFDQIDYLYKIAERMNGAADTILVLDSEEKVRSNAKIFKYITDPKNIIECADYTPIQLKKLVTNILKKVDIADVEKITASIIAKVDNNPYILESEAEKIALLGSKVELTSEIIEQSLIGSVNFTIWEYLNSILNGNKFKAVSTVMELIENGENEYSIIGMILWNLKLVSVVKLGVGKSDAQIASEFGYSPYSIKNTRAVLNRFSLERIGMLYEKIIDLDEKIKSGLIDPQFGLLLLSLMF